MKRSTMISFALMLTVLFCGTFNARPVSAAEPDCTRHCGIKVRPGQTQARVGEPAPNFTLDAVVGSDFKKVSLTDYRGKWVVLFFYPLDFTFVCPTEIRGFNEKLDAFNKLNAVVLGASVDSKYSHLAWIKRGDLGDLKLSAPLRL